jgi:hypothetical protein
LLALKVTLRGLTIKDSKVLGNIAPTEADLFTLGAVTLDDRSVGVIGP